MGQFSFRARPFDCPNPASLMAAVHEVKMSRADLLPFPVWMALARPSPAGRDGQTLQPELGDATAAGKAGADAANDDPLRRANDA